MPANKQRVAERVSGSLRVSLPHRAFSFNAEITELLRVCVCLCLCLCSFSPASVMTDLCDWARQPRLALPPQVRTELLS